MDRSDERKDHPGSILDIGETAGSNLPPNADPLDTDRQPKGGSHSVASEEERRRRRMRDGADAITTGTNDLQRGTGATSIDMGAGGEGTDVEP